MIPESDYSSKRTITDDVLSETGDSEAVAETEDVKSDGDAQSQHGTESERTDSFISDVADGSDDEQQDEQPDETSSSISPEPVRRSTRDRKPPAWMQSGQFDLSKSVGSVASGSEWFQKIHCITSLANTNLFQNLQDDAARAILDIVKSTPNPK